MAMSDDAYAGGRRMAFICIVVGLLVFACIAYLFFKSDPQACETSANNTLVVYCAASMRLPLEMAAEAFKKEYQNRIIFQYASSGELEGKLRLDASMGGARADLYIPADDFFAERARLNQVVTESIQLASFSLVLAVKPEYGLRLHSVQGLIDSDVAFAICNKEAGVGKKTEKVLGALGLYEAKKKKKTVEFPTVTELCQSIQMSESIDAGFVWDATARQFGLKIIRLDELEGAKSTISANLVAGSGNSVLAMKFARFLASPEKGNVYFDRFHFTPIAGYQRVKKP